RGKRGSASGVVHSHGLLVLTRWKAGCEQVGPKAKAHEWPALVDDAELSDPHPVVNVRRWRLAALDRSECIVELDQALAVTYPLLRWVFPIGPLGSQLMAALEEPECLDEAPLHLKGTGEFAMPFRIIRAEPDGLAVRGLGILVTLLPLEDRSLAVVGVDEKAA